MYILLQDFFDLGVQPFNFQRDNDGESATLSSLNVALLFRSLYHEFGGTWNMKIMFASCWFEPIWNNMSQMGSFPQLG